MLTVNEVFFSIQGEGARVGRPCVFVRLTGCPLRCRWCDTAYAFSEGQPQDEDALLARLETWPCRLLQLTGGEPLAQAEAFPFVGRALDRGWEVVVETSGHVSLEGLDARAAVVMDLKPPGSGESHRTDWRNLDRLKPSDEVKFVVLGRDDYDWSKQVVDEHRLAARCSVLFSPVHGRLDPGELARWILADGLPVRLQVQLHKYLWPGLERGV